MKVFVVLSAVVAFAVAKPTVLATAPIAYATAPFAAPIVAPFAVAAPVISSQYHAQDELGQYSYGYASPLSAKTEVKTADGITRGGYSYIDAEGKLQRTEYVADALGFRSASSNLPVAPLPEKVPIFESPKPVIETVEVAKAKIAHFAAHEEAKARLAAAAKIEIIEKVETPAIVAAPAPVAPVRIADPAVAAPIVAPAVTAPIVAPAVTAPIVTPVVTAPIVAAPFPKSFGYSTLTASPFITGYSAPFGIASPWATPVAWSGMLPIESMEAKAKMLEMKDMKEFKEFKEMKEMKKDMII